eukprot:1402479-Pyramimonas_sp.AAC.1
MRVKSSQAYAPSAGVWVVLNNFVLPPSFTLEAANCARVESPPLVRFRSNKAWRKIKRQGGDCAIWLSANQHLGNFEKVA